MIYRIADPARGGKGVVGVYPQWDDEGDADARVLQRLESRDVSVLFTRNNVGAFFDRIAPALRRYGHLVDVVCGWEVERLRMFFLPFNPDVEVFPVTAMHFNTFDLLHDARRQAAGRDKAFDIFFATADRPDGLKNTELLGRLLGSISRSVKVAGYGRLPDEVLAGIAGNPLLELVWCGKAAVTDPAERLSFLLDLARSRCLLMTSRVEGYSRLVGEALFLGVPVMLPAGILCDNWPHLNETNSRLYVEALFDRCLDDVLAREWHIDPPEYADGNQFLRQQMEAYMVRRTLPLPRVWYPLRYGALTDQRIDEEHFC